MPTATPKRPTAGSGYHGSLSYVATLCHTRCHEQDRSVPDLLVLCCGQRHPAAAVVWSRCRSVGSRDRWCVAHGPIDRELRGIRYVRPHPFEGGSSDGT